MQDYLDFPYAAQVYCLQRETTELSTGKFRSETVYGVTSLSAPKAGPTRLLSLNRCHWSIENGLHYVRDMSFDEDRCRIRKFAGVRSWLRCVTWPSACCVWQEPSTWLPRFAFAVTVSSELCV